VAKNLFSSKDISEATRRRVELAIAVAQERLLATHVDHALSLIQLVGDQVPFENALAIYTRLLRLSDDEARVITTRALAILGERAAESESWPELITEAEVKAASDEGGRRNLIRTVRQRLRGRVKEDLRRWVELAAAQTEVAILNTHVENALNFVDLLDKEELSFTEAVELYLEALGVRESVSEVAYYFALTRLAEKHLPQAGTASQEAAQSA
jgi:hypothetical protein